MASSWVLLLQHCWSMHLALACADFCASSSQRWMLCVETSAIYMDSYGLCTELAELHSALASLQLASVLQPLALGAASEMYL